MFSWLPQYLSWSPNTQVSRYLVISLSLRECDAQEGGWQCPPEMGLDMDLGGQVSSSCSLLLSPSPHCFLGFSQETGHLSGESKPGTMRMGGRHVFQ